MKKISILFCLLEFLNGCATTPAPEPSLIVTKTQVYIPPDKFFECSVPTLPSKFNTHNEVSVLIVKLYSSNVQCKNNMGAIKNSLTNAQKTLNN